MNQNPPFMTPGLVQPSQPQTNETAPLTPEERRQLQRLMGHPSDYPKALGSWVTEYLKVNPPESLAGLGGRGAVRALDANADSVTATSTSETTIYSTKVPGGTLGSFGQLNVVLYGNFSCADASNEVVFRIRLGGTQIATWTITTASLDGNSQPFCTEFRITAAGSPNVQFVNGLFGWNLSASGPAGLFIIGQGAKNLSEEQELSVSADWNGAGTQTFVKVYAAATAIKFLTLDR